jgi:hypothetical protein
LATSARKNGQGLLAETGICPAGAAPRGPVAMRLSDMVQILKGAEYEKRAVPGPGRIRL